MHSLRLRPATVSDLMLTYEITKDAMRPYVEKTWGIWDDGEQWKKHETNFTPKTHKIILLKDEDVGLLAVEDLSTHLWLVKLYLLAHARNQGIGSSILEGLLQESARQSKPIRLRVLKVNLGAQDLYIRHGFKVINETPERLFMERGV